MLLRAILPPLEERDEQCALDLVKQVGPCQKRVILFGGTLEFTAHLIFEGIPQNAYKVVLVDASEDIINMYREEIGCYSRELAAYLEICVCDWENPADTRFTFEPDDVVLCVRMLHHMDRPTQALQRIKAAVPHGVVLIVDTTEELFDELIARHEAERSVFRATLADEGATEELAMYEQHWQHVDWHFTQCSIGLENVGFRDEHAIKRFLVGTDLNNGRFEYAPECPCGGACGTRGGYWFYLWQGAPATS